MLTGRRRDTLQTIRGGHGRLADVATVLFTQISERAEGVGLIGRHHRGRREARCNFGDPSPPSTQPTWLNRSNFWREGM